MLSIILLVAFISVTIGATLVPVGFGFGGTGVTFFHGSLAP